MKARILDIPVVELIIFDGDGVLFNHRDAAERHFSEAARHAGLSQKALDRFFANLGNDDYANCHTITATAAVIWPDSSPEQLRVWQEELWRIERARPLGAIAGAVETLQWVRRRGIKTGLCTNNDDEILAWKLQETGISQDLFDVIYTSSNGASKPNPHALRSVYWQAGVPHDHTLYVGDWYTDIYCARMANIEFIGVLTGFLPREGFLRECVAEDHIVDSVADLPKLCLIE